MNHEFLPAKSELPEEVKEKFGEKIIAAALESESKQELSETRRELLAEGEFPAETEEGMKKCFDYLCASAVDGTFVSNSVSRKMRMDDYKNPDWSEPDTREQQLDASVDVAFHMIESIREVYRNGGTAAVQEQFPGVAASGVDMSQLLTISKDVLAQCFNEPDNARVTDSLRKIINCCWIGGEYAGAPQACPYKLSTVSELQQKYNAEDARSDGRYRFYLNAPSGKARCNFLALYAKKCIDQRIPFEMKGIEVLNNGTTSEPSRADGIILYAQAENFEESLRILKEIEKENPELAAKFGSPVATAEKMSYFGVSQSRKDATWNYLFDRVSKNAFHKTIAEAMGLPTDDARYSQPDADKQIAKGMSGLSDEMIDFIRNGGANSLHDSFISNLKQMFSLANFGDTKHQDAHFCFSDCFYSEEENK